MKRQVLTVCCLLFIAFSSKAQLDTIPNAGFENWIYLPNNTVQAVGWHANNSSIAAWNVTPDSVANSGFLSARIEKVSYRGILWSGFPVAHHPLTLDGAMRNFIGLADTALISVQVYQSGFPVDSGYAEIYGGAPTNFLPFTLNISQNASGADSCVITLTGGNQSGSIIWFDDLAFSFPTSVDEGASGTGTTIFPNPVRDKLVVGSPEFGDRYELTIHNMLGELILIQPQTSNLKPQTIDVSQLSPGTYLLSITGDKKRYQTIILKD